MPNDDTDGSISRSVGKGGDLVLALQDWLANIIYKKNESLLVGLLTCNFNDTLLDIGGGTGMIVDHILAKTSCKEACIAELECKKLYFASSAVASFKRREKRRTYTL